MADSAVPITAGTGTNIDTRTAPDGNHRQVMVIGDETNADIADVTNPANLSGALNTGSQGGALNVNPNAIQKATFLASVGAVQSGALVANTRKDMFSIEHAAASTKTARIRRIQVSGLQTTALAGTMQLYLFRGTAATSAGTTFTPAPSVPGATAADTVCKSVPTLTAATQLIQRTPAIVAATTGTGYADFLLYDWQEVGETIPLTLRAGNLDAYSIAIQSSVAHNITMSVVIIFTEE